LTLLYSLLISIAQLHRSIGIAYYSAVQYTPSLPQSHVDISPCEERYLIAYTLSRYCTAKSIRLTVRQIRASFTIFPTNSVNITKDTTRNDRTIHESRTVVIHYLFKDECMFRVTSSYEFPSEHSPTPPGLDSFSYLPRHP